MYLPKYSILYFRTRKLIISHCYFLLSRPWDHFFNMINSSLITVFDCSSCYWIPAKDLCAYISKMDTLTELSIQDTRISLENLPLVFETCQQIVKLGFTLAEKSLEQYRGNTMDEKDLERMEEGFGKLTHLKIFTCMGSTVRHFSEPWLATLRVLA